MARRRNRKKVGKGTPDTALLPSPEKEVTFVKSSKKESASSSKKSPTVRRARSNSTSLFRLAATKVPQYLREQYVLTHYRKEGLSYWQCFRSLFKLHNETFNCWTHLLGFVVFITLALSTAWGGIALPSEQSLARSETSLAVHRQLDVLGSQLREASEVVLLEDETIFSSSSESHSEMSLKHGENVEDLSDESAPSRLDRALIAAEELHQRLSANVSTATHLVRLHLEKSGAKIGEDIVKFLERSREALDRLEEKLLTRKTHLAENFGNLRSEVRDQMDKAKTASQTALKNTIEFVEHLSDSLFEEFSSLGRLQAPGNIPVRWPLVLYLVAVSVTLLCSAVFHTFMCCGRTAYGYFVRLDYAGVSVQIVSSVLVIVHYAFADKALETWRTLYLTTMVTIGVALLLVVCLEYFDGYRQLRAGLFVLLASFGLLPVVHLSFVYGLDHWLISFMVRRTILTCACYLVGVAIFVTRVPERFLPGRFDLAAKSHEAWHMAVVVAALVHYSFALELYRIAPALG